MEREMVASSCLVRIGSSSGANALLTGILTKARVLLRMMYPVNKSDGKMIGQCNCRS